MSLLVSVVSNSTAEGLLQKITSSRWVEEQGGKTFNLSILKGLHFAEDAQA